MNINQLLEKYWKAETSLQEEAELRAYFSGDDIAAEHLQFKDLFSFFSFGRMQSTDLDVEDVLTSLSDIDDILEKYWNAEASLEEEAQLKDYFASEHVAPQHEQYKDLFVYYAALGQHTTDLEMESILSNEMDIDSLLEKYWNAETNLEEEKVLRTYFAGDNVEERHESYRDMFDVYASIAGTTTDLDIEKVLLNAESEAGNRAIGSTINQGPLKTKVFSLQKWAVAIAAVFVLGFAVVNVMNPTAPTTKYKGHATVLDDESEAQEAYEITKEALAFLSKNMNKGSETIVKSVSKAEKVNIFK